MISDRIDAAIALIQATPGFATVAQRLSEMQTSGRIRFVPTLIDRGQATLTGAILLGPESIDSNIVSLAETLVHEEFHTRQNPFLKTRSFWLGVATRSHTMQRYEMPAYRAALNFLNAVAEHFPELAADAIQEADLVRVSFESFYRTALTES